MCPWRNDMDTNLVLARLIGNQLCKHTNLKLQIYFIYFFIILSQQLISNTIIKKSLLVQNFKKYQKVLNKVKTVYDKT